MNELPESLYDYMRPNTMRKKSGVPGGPGVHTGGRPGNVELRRSSPEVLHTLAWCGVGGVPSGRRTSLQPGVDAMNSRVGLSVGEHVLNALCASGEVASATLSGDGGSKLTVIASRAKGGRHHARSVGQERTLAAASRH